MYAHTKNIQCCARVTLDDLPDVVMRYVVNMCIVYKDLVLDTKDLYLILISHIEYQRFIKQTPKIPSLIRMHTRLHTNTTTTSV